MPDLVSLHNTRQRIGKIRQPTHSTKLSEFNQAINSVGISSAFDMQRRGYEELNKIVEYSQGSQGKIVNVSSDYIYRIALI